MEQAGRMHSTPLGQWSSESMFVSTPHSADTVHQSLEASGSGSNLDSGYCSHTPSSNESYTSRQKSNKYLNLSHTQNTPGLLPCSHKRSSFYETPNLSHLQAISEANVSCTQKLLPRGRPLDLSDDVMDTSLYPDDMEVEQNDFEGHQCALDAPEIGEENSIDFTENVDLNILDEENASGSIVSVLNDAPNKFSSPDPEYIDIDCDLIGSKVANENTLDNSRQSRKFQGVAKKVTTLAWVVRTFSHSGIETLDFFYQLGVKRNLHHVIGQILSYLSGKDLNSVMKVSQTWSEMLQKNRPAYDRWQEYTTKTLWELNMTSPRKQRTEPTSPLRALHNLDRSSSVNRRFSPRLVSPPVSPESARFRSFQKAAKNLKHGERLLPCPRCYFPSHDHGNPTVQCSRSGCRHHFCVWCRNEVLPNVRHNCPPLYTPQLRRSIHKIHSIGSKSSKRILRRL